MGLVGNLEDLGLGDILQIVSLSKKSGVLSLESGGRTGAIMFLEGQVVRATSCQFKEHLGDILLKYRLTTEVELAKALTIQAGLDRHLPLGQVLSRHFGVAQEKIEAAIKAKIEKIVYSFFAWSDGVFSFHLEEPESFGSARLDPLDFMLEQGLSPQWLALEGRRLANEGRILPDWPGEERIEDALEDPPASFPMPQLGIEAAPDDAASAPLPGDALLLVIDDDAVTCAALEKAFSLAGYEVQTCPRTAEYLETCDLLVARGQRPALLIDLIMPRLDGHGILGGLEVMELVRQKYPHLPLLLMTDHPSVEAEEKARELGALAVLQKPRKEDVRDPVGVELLRGLVLSVSSLLHPEPERIEQNYNLGNELLEFSGQENLQTSAPAESPGLYLLKGMLQELASPLLGGGIILLTLRFASELMNRAVIFDVRDNSLVGLGQFGLDSFTDQADAMVRKMRLEVTPDSVLHQVLTRKVAIKAQLGCCETDLRLRDQLGGIEASECFLGPLVSEGRVVAILYGDNLPQQKPIGDVDAFEVFLSQAGMAMEKVLLERRLNSQTLS
ncbi:MAG: response regulator [Desulfuromonadales bacterium]|nr:response regulator [Desulfuromonadales bacterium]